MLPNEQLQAIRERVIQASDGPWGMRRENGTMITDEYGFIIDEPLRYQDAIFIAHSRTDIPALLNEIERRERVLELNTELAMNNLRLHGEIERLRNIVSESVQVIEELAEDIIRAYPERADVQTSDVLPSLFTASEFRRKVCQALEGYK